MDPAVCECICGNPAGCSNIAYPVLVLKILQPGGQIAKFVFFQSSGGKIDGVNSSKNNTLIYQLIMLRDPSCPSSNSAAKESFSIKRK